MDIKNARDLAKIFTICRKNGVESLKVAKDGSLEFTLKDGLPTKARRKKGEPKVEETDEAAPPKEYSSEDILMWSAQGSSLAQDEN